MKVKNFLFIDGDNSVWKRIIVLPWIILAITLSLLGFADQGINGLFLGLLISLLYGAALFVELIPGLGIFVQFILMNLMSTWLYQITKTVETSLTIWCFWMYMVIGIVINFVAIAVAIKYCVDSRHEI